MADARVMDAAAVQMPNGTVACVVLSGPKGNQGSNTIFLKVSVQFMRPLLSPAHAKFPCLHGCQTCSVESVNYTSPRHIGMIGCLVTTAWPATHTTPQSMTVLSYLNVEWSSGVAL